MKDRPPEVTASHLARRAAVYARQSTARQVDENEGSTDYQRDQIKFPLAWGWPAADVDLNDDDLGYSGTTTVRRRGYQRLLEYLRGGRLGAIFVSDLSRLGRDAVELLTLLNECKLRDVLIVVNGSVYNLDNSGQMFGHQVTTLVAEYENVRRAEMMQAGRRAKALAGKAVSAPPTGYVRAEKGVWHMHPDPAVQEALRAVFRVFLCQRALVPTMHELRQLGIKIPSRKAGGQVEWKEATVSLIGRILHNPAYTADYVYPQRRVDHGRGRTRQGHVRVRQAQPDETIVNPGQHPAYVSRSEWEQVQNILTMNAPAKARRNLGPGSAWLQGLVRCGQHGARAMSVSYHRKRSDGQSSHGYQCNGDYLTGGRQCGSGSGSRLDAAIVEAVLARLRPPRLQVVRDAWRQARLDAAGEARRSQVERRRAEQAVDDARFRLLNVNPANRLVAEEYESALEEAKRNLQRHEAGAATEPSEVEKFTEAHWQELLSLCQDLGALWGAPTTTDRDRKQLIRTVVQAVIVEKRTREMIRARIVWVDGEADTVVEIKLAPYAHRIMAQLDARGLRRLPEN